MLKSVARVVLAELPVRERQPWRGLLFKVDDDVDLELPDDEPVKYPPLDPSLLRKGPLRNTVDYPEQGWTADAIKDRKTWNESLHPRVPAGSGDPSGEFTSVDGGSAVPVTERVDRTPATEEEIQRVQDRLEATGIKIVSVQDVSPIIKASIDMRDAPLSGMIINELDGCADALEEVQAKWPGFDGFIKDSGLGFVVANHLPPQASMGTSFGGDELIISLNAQSETLEGIRQSARFTIGNAEGARVLRATGSEPKAMRAAYRAIMFHELGHAIDGGTGGTITEHLTNIAMQHVSRRPTFVPPRNVYQLNDMMRDAGKYAARAIGSRYAGTDPSDAMAEAFAKILMGGHLPPAFKGFETSVRRLGREPYSPIPQKEWDPDKHPRVPAGSGDPSGEFTSVDGGEDGGAVPMGEELLRAPFPKRLSVYGQMDKTTLEAHIRKEPVEFLALFDKDGKNLGVLSDDEPSHVEVPRSIASKLREADVITHNHPKGVSFSPSDISLFMLSTSATEMRVVGPEYTYRMMLPNGTRADKWLRQHPSAPLEMEYAVRKHEKLTYEKFKPLVKAGAMTVAEANIAHWHEVWSGAADEAGLLYERVKS